MSDVTADLPAHAVRGWPRALSISPVRTHYPVVVGVDSSASSRAALEFAATEARLRRLPLDIITTWEFPTTYGEFSPDIDFAADAKRILDETVRSALGEGSELSITTTIIQGHATGVLVGRSHSAALLVVGGRGHGGFGGLFLGSVSEHLAKHAGCPVVIVHARQ